MGGRATASTRGVPTPVRLVERAMTAGSVGFAAAVLLAPTWSGRVAGVGPRTARLLGARDLVVAALLVRPGGPIGLTARGSSDLVDAVLMARRRPPLALLAGLSGAVSLRAALTARRATTGGG